MMWSAHTRRGREESSIDNRPKLLAAVIFLFAFAIAARLFNVQVLNYDVYAARAGQQHDIEEELMPQRGRIFVRSGKNEGTLYPLAANKEFALVYAVPKDILQPQQAAEKIAPLLYPLRYEAPDTEKLMAEIEQRIRKEFFEEAMAKHAPAEGEEVALPEEEIAVAIEKERLVLLERLQKEKEAAMEQLTAELTETFSKDNDPYEPLAQKVDKDRLQRIMDLTIPGISYSLAPYRYYPEADIASHTLGFVVEQPEGGITQGSYGIEGYFDELLAGKSGVFTGERDAAGRTVIVADRHIIPPVDGGDIVLTLDKTVQDVACRKLNEAALRHGADVGAVVIMEPQTGAVQALCSYPTFDPNDYGETEDISNFNNIAIYDSYEPGSVFKTITMAIGIDTGQFEPETKFTDPGSVTIAKETIHNSDNNVYGEITMNEALEFSVNTAMVHVARTVGVRNFRKYVKEFGFGQKTGIALNTESAGTVASLNDAMHGGDLNLAVASFGQSITTTPLQLATAYAALANGGVLMKPYIVDEIIYADGTRVPSEPQEIRRVVTPRTAALVNGMLVNVVDGGHAAQAAVDGYYVGGKTGTAQIAASNRRGYSNRTSHTFVGLAPANNPRFVMAVYLKDPKDVRYSASSAAPLFGEIADFLLDYYQVEKER